jgi:hypothetical protein
VNVQREDHGPSEFETEGALYHVVNMETAS